MQIMCMTCSRHTMGFKNAVVRFENQKHSQTITTPRAVYTWLVSRFGFKVFFSLLTRRDNQLFNKTISGKQ